MKKHLISFLKSPIGYIANFIATLTQYVPEWVNCWFFDWWIIPVCEICCLKDGIQDDPMF